jgi:hypothetical protein
MSAAAITSRAVRAHITVEAAIIKICDRHRWPAMWFRLGCIIVSAGGRSWQVKSSDDPCPANVDALGCTGTAATGRLSWIGFDLDVGHGRLSYSDTETALVDARRIRNALEGRAEIRLSKSGIGVHVRHLLPDAPVLPNDQGPVIAKKLAAKLNVKADPAALGRQAFWLWTRTPAPNAFKLIEEHVHD